MLALWHWHEGDLLKNAETGNLCKYLDVSDGIFAAQRIGFALFPERIHCFLWAAFII